MNLYEQLGVSDDATPDDIKSAYRDRVRAVHPDKGGSNEECAAVNHAYAILSDPSSRAAYDRGDIDEDGSVSAAQALLETIWSEILGNRHTFIAASTDLVAVAQRMTAAVRNQIALDRNKITIERDRLQDIASRLTNADILQAVTQAKAAALTKQLSALDAQDATAVAAAAMLEHAKYRYETDPVRARGGVPYEDLFRRSQYTSTTTV